MLDPAAGTETELTGTALREAKRALRTRMIAARDALDLAYRATASLSICTRVASLPSFAAARVVLVTLPFGSEWDTRPLARAALACGKTLVLPRVNGETRMLELHAIRDITADVTPGYQGIPEPLPTLPRVDSATIDWVLVPGVAFSRTGRRLGYGGGYYDRLMILLRPTTQRVAGAFDAQIAERIPAASHDLSVDMIVTESRILAAPART
jgi:5,10-methenyltetrahydrofolate synthetase